MPIASADLPGHRRIRELVEVALGSLEERPNLDFKQSAPWDDLKLRTIRACLAMANLRDGGVVLVGVREDGRNWIAEGVTAEHLATFDQDDIAAAVDSFASPAVSVHVIEVRVADKRFVTIQVDEFHETPVVCKKDGPADVPPPKKLEKGAFYVRPAGGEVRTVRVTDAAQMHEILEIAAEKRARRIIAVSERIRTEPADQRYDDELGGL